MKNKPYDDSQGGTGSDKRKYTRIGLSLETFFVLQVDGREDVYKAVTKNISYGGMCLSVTDSKEHLIPFMKDPLPRIKLSFTSPDGDGEGESHGDGEWIPTVIDWAERPSADGDGILMGIAFDGISPDVRDRINSIVDEHLEGDTPH